MSDRWLPGGALPHTNRLAVRRDSQQSAVTAGWSELCYEL